MPPPRGRQTEAAQALAAAAPLVTRWMERLLAGQKPPLTVTQYLALRAIEREGVSGTELALRSGVSAPAVSQLLAGLADAGLVERQLAEDDRRRRTLALTRSGARAFARAEASLSEGLASLLTELPKPEADALARSLPNVEAMLSGSPPPRRPPHPPPRTPKPSHPSAAAGRTRGRKP
jgi:DNA-binding MarR family transcriptional regulator